MENRGELEGNRAKTDRCGTAKNRDRHSAGKGLVVHATYAQDKTTLQSTLGVVGVVGRIEFVPNSIDWRAKH